MQNHRRLHDPRQDDEYTGPPLNLYAHGQGTKYAPTQQGYIPSTERGYLTPRSDIYGSAPQIHPVVAQAQGSPYQTGDVRGQTPG